jgi:hypothetical protein
MRERRDTETITQYTVHIIIEEAVAKAVDAERARIRTLVEGLPEANIQPYSQVERRAVLALIVTGAPTHHFDPATLDSAVGEEQSVGMDTTTYPATHTTAPVIAHAASEPGALPGFETVCYDCGLRMSNTVRSNVEADARDHIAYWEAKAAGPKAMRTFLLRGDR